MAGKAVIVKLTEAELKTLRRWEKMPSLEYRLVQRAKIILAANTGETNTSIAEDLNVRRATASKWRCRYARQGIEGLYDFPRNGRRATYSRKDEKRVLSTLDRPVPEGEMIWTAKLISRQLENVSVDYVWRVFRKHGIHLQRRRSWCVSTDPQFAEKSADIVGLYISPPESAIVLSVDEKPCIQALERAQGYLRLPDGSTVTGFSDRYRRHGTTTLFAALEVATGLIKTGHYKRRRRREFLDFMNDIVKSYPEDKEIHVILDNLNTHKPKNEKWPLSQMFIFTLLPRMRVG